MRNVGTCRPDAKGEAQADSLRKEGRTRPSGIRRVADRIAMTVVTRYLEPILEPVFHGDSYGYRPERSAHVHCAWHGSDAGATTGCSTSTSGTSSMKLIGNSCYERCADTLVHREMAESTGEHVGRHAGDPRERDAARGGCVAGLGLVSASSTTSAVALSALVPCANGATIGAG